MVIFTFVNPEFHTNKPFLSSLVQYKRQHWHIKLVLDSKQRFLHWKLSCYEQGWLFQLFRLQLTVLLPQLADLPWYQSGVDTSLCSLNISFYGHCCLAKQSLPCYLHLVSHLMFNFLNGILFNCVIPSQSVKTAEIDCSVSLRLNSTSIHRLFYSTTPSVSTLVEDGCDSTDGSSDNLFWSLYRICNGSVYGGWWLVWL